MMPINIDYLEMPQGTVKKRTALVIESLQKAYFDIQGIASEMKDNKKEMGGDPDNAEFFELLFDLRLVSTAASKLFAKAMDEGLMGPEALGNR